MLRHLLAVVLPILGVLWAQGAYAQDEGDTDDEIIFDSDKEDPPKDPPKSDPKTPPAKPTPAKPSSEPTEDDDLDIDDEETPPDAPKKDIFEEDEEDRDDDELVAPGTDTPDLYRAKQDEVEDLPADEEVMAWEAYLAEYPNSLYRKRIQERIDELVADQFNMRIDGGTRPGARDADDEELLFVQPLHMTNVNPRTKAQVGFLFGAPQYLEIVADFEYAFHRQASAHVGFGSRYAGWGLDVGARYAFVKSQRLDFIATLVADIGLNFNQRVTGRIGDELASANDLFFQARPQLALGKIVGPVQMIASFGADIGTRKNTQTALIGGFHIQGRIAPPFAVFAETDFHIRNFGQDRTTFGGGTKPFAFSVLSFGFRFYPMPKKPNDPMEVVVGGHLPYVTQYLGYYEGAVQAQAVYYPTVNQNK